MNPHTLPKLPYAYNALEPHIDAKTMEIHYTKHHQAYVDKLNEALKTAAPELQQKSVEDLLKAINDVPEQIRQAVINHGGGHANHSLFWKTMSPNGGGAPTGPLADGLKAAFTSFDNFKAEFTKAALGRFGSGWAWLTMNKGSLKIYSTANQDSPLMVGDEPILCLDMWEHSFYIKWQWRKADYVNAWLNVVNWPEVDKNYQRVANKK